MKLEETNTERRKNGLMRHWRCSFSGQKESIPVNIALQDCEVVHVTAFLKRETCSFGIRAILFLAFEAALRDGVLVGRAISHRSSGVVDTPVVRVQVSSEIQCLASLQNRMNVRMMNEYACTKVKAD